MGQRNDKHKGPIGAAAAADVIHEPEILNSVFLMKVAQMLGPEYLELGIFLGLPSTTVRRIVHDNKDLIPIHFTVLENWYQINIHSKTLRVMSENLCEALGHIGRADIQEFVRSEENRRNKQEDASNLTMPRVKLKSRVTAGVVYEYIAAEDDELSIHPGDIITEVVTLKGGWWEGVLNGKKGLFPDNFVKVQRLTSTKGRTKRVQDGLAKQSTGEVNIKTDHPVENKVAAEVVHEYIAVEDDELSIHPGDIITEIVICQNVWCEGMLNGKKGFFPKTCVKVQTLTSVKGRTKRVQDGLAKQSTGEVNIKTDHLDEKTETTEDVLGRVKVLLNYAPEFEDELVLEVDDIIEVKSQLEEGWWEGVLNGKQGAFPSNYVEVIEDQELHTKKIAQRALALYSYEAEEDTELSIEPGQIIAIFPELLKHYGWWMGELNGRVGIFPSNYVELIPGGVLTD